MYRLVVIAGQVLPVFLFPALGLAAVTMLAGLGGQRSVPALRRGLRRSSRLILSVVVAGIGKAAIALATLSYGWAIAQPRVAIEAPLAAAAAVCGLVAWLELRRSRQVIASAGDGPADPRLLRQVLGARVLWPAWAAGVVLAACGVVILGGIGTATAVGLAVLACVALVLAALGRWLGGERAPTPRLKVWGVVRGLLVGASVIAVIVVTIVAGTVGSSLPSRYSMAAHDLGTVDFGGGPEFGPAGHGGSHAGMSVTELTGAQPPADAPVRRFELTARERSIAFSDGTTSSAWTFNGQTPGPEIRVERGDVVEVTLRNELPGDTGVTIHWHGIDVPNAVDGVAGMTQDAVLPGESFTYRFRAQELGTHWYHSHQQSSEQVRRGLFGPIVIVPEGELEPSGVDVTLLRHTYGDTVTYNGRDGETVQQVTPGTPVRVRLINTDNEQARFAVRGTEFAVAAIDGNDVNAPTPLAPGTQLPTAAGGRHDVTFTMPGHPVRIDDGSGPALVVSPDGLSTEAPDDATTAIFQPWEYGAPAPTEIRADTTFDREFTMVFDQQLLGRQMINGRLFPNTPTFMIREGDVVKTTFINRAGEDHPMHLHGHHITVLTRNGQPVSGSPWVVDTLNVAPGEVYEVGFRGDNPGVWMDHCHNLEHAADGMSMHLAYDGVTTPFEAGPETPNQPE